MPGVKVVCTYTWQGQQRSKEAVTDAQGNCTLPDIPLDVPVTVQETRLGEKQTVTCTSQEPTAVAKFGYFGIL